MGPIAALHHKRKRYDEELGVCDEQDRGGTGFRSVLTAGNARIRHYAGKLYQVSFDVGVCERPLGLRLVSRRT